MLKITLALLKTQHCQAMDVFKPDRVDRVLGAFWKW